MSPLDECCTTCECGRVYCRDNDSGCPDCAPDPERCGRPDEHPAHEWSRRGYGCSGRVVIEGGYEAVA